MNKILFELEPNAYEPKKMHPNDAGFDLAVPNGNKYVLKSMEQKVIDTGVRVAIPHGYVGLVTTRSSKAEIGIRIVLGVIDSGYTGTIKLIVNNIDDTSVSIHGGNRLAQLIIVPICIMPSEVVPHIDRDTERGENGLGSTGKG